MNFKKKESVTSPTGSMYNHSNFVSEEKHKGANEGQVAPLPMEILLNSSYDP